jgi:hypothetical protein
MHRMTLSTEHWIVGFLMSTLSQDQDPHRGDRLAAASPDAASQTSAKTKLEAN